MRRWRGFDRVSTTGEPGRSRRPPRSRRSRMPAIDYPSDGQIAEITVAQRRGRRDRLPASPMADVGAQNRAHPLSSDLAEPMRRALSGQSGSMIGLDYHGVEVLAAYQPVPVLNAGVVAKMDLENIRAPFLRGAAMVIGLALVLVTAGNGALRASHQPDRQAPERDRAALPAHLLRRPGTHLGAGLLQVSAGPARPQGVQAWQTWGLTCGPPRDLARACPVWSGSRTANAAALKLFGARSSRQFVAWFEQGPSFRPPSDVHRPAASPLGGPRGASEPYLLPKTLRRQGADG